jgi:hypothetical protein
MSQSLSKRGQVGHLAGSKVRLEPRLVTATVVHYQRPRWSGICTWIEALELILGWDVQESIDFFREHGYVRLKNVFNAATLEYYGNAITQYVEATEHVWLPQL